MNLTDIISDLLEFEPIEITIPASPYKETDTFEQKFDTTYRLLQRYTRFRNRHQSLLMAFYLGSLLDELPRSERMKYKNKLTTHYYRGCVRTHYIFFTYGIEQIFRTKSLNLVEIVNMSARDFKTFG